MKCLMPPFLSQMHHLSWQSDQVPLTLRFSQSQTFFLQHQNRRMRRKKKFYDESIVLTNRTMKKALEDTSDILRKRKPLPYSDLGISKLQKRLRNEQIFYEPLFTGMSRDLGDMFQIG